MKLLILATDGNEPSLAAMEYMLDRLGTPYQVVRLAKGEPLPALSNGTKGFFQGVILTTGNLGICDPTCHSALPAAGWTALDTYTRDYQVRTVSYYTFPDPRYGLTFSGNAVSTSDDSPAYVTLTSAASSIFPYLVQSSTIKIANSYVYLASAVAATGETTTPIATLNGSVVAVTHKDTEGRESLALTMDNNPYLLHSQLFHYGLIRWITKGVFLGSRQVYLTPQVDDVFLPNDLFDQFQSACIPVGAAADPTFDPANQCQNLRISGTDLNGLATWQNQIRSNSQTSKFRVSLAFNGFGATAEGGAAPNDSLVLAAKTQANAFFWINHTYDHESLDCYKPVANSGVCTPATNGESASEIGQNISVASSLGLAQDRPSMVTPAITGLKNQGFADAALAQGIKYLVSDLSRPEGVPAIPNTVRQNAKQPSILEIPRRATAVFYNTATPVSGVGSETDEYNYFYGPNGIFRIGGPDGPPFFTTDQTYQQIVDRESNAILGYMLQYEMYPLMFHQANVYRYDGVNSILTDVMNATLTKFKALSNLPVNSAKQSDLGVLLANRLGYMNSQIQATWNSGSRSIQITTTGSPVVPFTGICSDTCSTYAQDQQSFVSMPSNGSRTIYY